MYLNNNNPSMRDKSDRNRRTRNKLYASSNTHSIGVNKQPANKSSQRRFINVDQP